jgi:hypothetical protein
VQLGNVLERRGIVADLEASNRIVEWAYTQTELIHGLTWLRADEMVPLAAEWRRVLSGR